MHAIHFSIFSLFGTSPFPWYFIYSVLFGFNAYLVYKLVGKLTHFVGMKQNALPIITAFLFLIHPYQSAAVVWKVCFHYLLATALILSTLLFTLNYIKHKRKVDSCKLGISFILGMFTHELMISIPLMTIVLAAVLFVEKNPFYKRLLLIVVIPQLLFLLLYFNLRPLLLLNTGKASVLSEHPIQPMKQLSAVYQYGTKHALFTRYWSHAAKQNWQLTLQKPAVLVTLGIITLFLIGLFFYNYRRCSPTIKLLGISLFLFATAIAPFSSAHISYILFVTNDMYGLSGSAFIICATVALLYLFPKRMRDVLVLLYATLSIILLAKTIYYWHESGAVMKSLQSDFRWYDAKNVYVLASPDNFRGINMMKSHEASMLDDHLLVENGTRPTCEITDIIQFNMTKRSDGVSVQVHSPDSLSVKFNQWGTWHWRNGIGASSYENEHFKVDLAIPYYHLKIKSRKAGDVFIYQDGMKWKEVEF